MNQGNAFKTRGVAYIPADRLVEIVSLILFPQPTIIVHNKVSFSSLVQPITHATKQLKNSTSSITPVTMVNKDNFHYKGHISIHRKSCMLVIVNSHLTLSAESDQ